MVSNLYAHRHVRGQTRTRIVTLPVPKSTFCSHIQIQVIRYHKKWTYIPNLSFSKISAVHQRNYFSHINKYYQINKVSFSTSIFAPYLIAESLHHDKTDTMLAQFDQVFSAN